MFNFNKIDRVKTPVKKATSINSLLHIKYT